MEMFLSAGQREILLQRTRLREFSGGRQHPAVSCTTDAFPRRGRNDASVLDGFIRKTGGTHSRRSSGNQSQRYGSRSATDRNRVSLFGIVRDIPRERHRASCNSPSIRLPILQDLSNWIHSQLSREITMPDKPPGRRPNGSIILPADKKHPAALSDPSRAHHPTNRIDPRPNRPSCRNKNSSTHRPPLKTWTTGKSAKPRNPNRHKKTSAARRQRKYFVFAFRVGESPDTRTDRNYNAFTCSCMALLRLPALFLCMILCLASLSSIAVTFGSKASAALFSVVLRKAFTALRAVL